MQINRWRHFKEKDTFFTLGWLLLKFVEYLFLEFFFVSLDKSVPYLLLRRCLMSKFPEILIVVCGKNFLFYSILSETFSNTCGFALYKADPLDEINGDFAAKLRRKLFRQENIFNFHVITLTWLLTTSKITLLLIKC